MLIKAIAILPKKSKSKKGIKCKDCCIEYSLEDYLTLFSLKKLIYFNIHDNKMDIYCHECCVKRLAFLKMEMPGLIFVIVNGKEEKIVDLK
jgi:hypothetical protein